MSKVLIVVAHPDDEVLGVGGAILKHVKEGDEVRILIMADGESARNEGVDIGKREAQAKKVGEVLGVKDIILEGLPDNAMDSLTLLEITKLVERVVFDFKPEIIYTHCPNDLNVDHRLAFQAVLTCCRPQPGFFVKKILAFETPSSTEWQIKDAAHIFCPTKYIDISEVIDDKINCLKIYKDELREYPHPRSLEGVKVLARFRGIEVGCEYAEAFQVIRILD